MDTKAKVSTMSQCLERGTTVYENTSKLLGLFLSVISGNPNVCDVNRGVNVGPENGYCIRSINKGIRTNFKWHSQGKFQNVSNCSQGFSKSCSVVGILNRLIKSVWQILF